MTRYIVVLLATGLLVGACGNPEVIAPVKPVEVVHMPLDGMVEADWENVLPMIYFSDDIDPSWLRRRERVGVTAGTSTPDAVIDEVVLALGKVGNVAQ